MESGERIFLAQLEHDHAEAGMAYRRLRSLAERAAGGEMDAVAIRGAAKESPPRAAYSPPVKTPLPRITGT